MIAPRWRNPCIVLILTTMATRWHGRPSIIIGSPLWGQSATLTMYPAGVLPIEDRFWSTLDMLSWGLNYGWNKRLKLTKFSPSSLALGSFIGSCTGCNSARWSSLTVQANTRSFIKLSMTLQDWNWSSFSVIISSYRLLWLGVSSYSKCMLSIGRGHLFMTKNTLQSG